MVIIYYKEVTSTMDIAHNYASKNFPHGTIILADIQTEGRGRLRRKWISPEGGLWFSIILYPSIPLKGKIDCLGILISVAVYKALDKFMKEKGILNFKWPNDIELNKKKVAGILLESVYENSEIKYIIAGVGINLFIEQSYFEKYNIDATSLKDLMLIEDKLIVLKEIRDHILSHMADFPENWDYVFRFYKSRFPYIGIMATNKINKKEVKIIDIEGDGSIILEEDKEIKKYSWGGISLEIKRITY